MFYSLRPILTVCAVCCLLVVLAMILDLAAGLWKAKLRGELRTSYGLRRTVSKFLSYIGSLLIASGIDVLIQLSRLPEILSLSWLSAVPPVSCMLAIFLLVVEFLSIREKTDAKARRREEHALRFLEKLLKSAIGGSSPVDRDEP